MEHALTNSAINKMKKDEIVDSLRQLKLNSRGNKEEVSKRLKTYWKRRRQAAKQTVNRSPLLVADRFFDFLCVVDFECTCEEGKDNIDYPHEIIEFPCILLRTSTREVVAEFHSFCRPVINPKLSHFCVTLTGITQEQVDTAPYFLDVFDQFKLFLDKYELGTTYRFALVADGSADFGHFLQRQCQQYSIPMPHTMRYWINLRRAYCRYYKRSHTSLQKMLAELGMEFTGRLHCGLDDARNIARIAATLLESGCELLINERLLRTDKLAAAGKVDNASPQQRERRKEDPTAISDQTGAANHRNDGAGERAQNGTCPGLPYKVLTVSKNEFMNDAYEQCFTCSEDEEETDNTGLI